MRLSVGSIITNYGMPPTFDERLVLNTEFDDLVFPPNVIVAIAIQAGFKIQINDELACAHLQTYSSKTYDICQIHLGLTVAVLDMTYALAMEKARK